jgi:fimbrial isopeptide formation D2 family protein
MHRTKFMGWLLGGMIAAILCLNLAPNSAGAAPLFGFTDTPIPLPPQPPATQSPPRSHPEVVDPIITKRADVEHAQVGDLVQYTLEVSNPNGVDVYNVVITDPLPEVVDFISTNTPQGSYNYDAASRTLTYDIGTLVGGQALDITIVVRVNSKATPPDQFSNAATLTWDDGRSVTSNTVVVTIIPSTLPQTGEGPGLGEIVVMAGALLLGLAGLGVTGFLLRRRRQPA